MKFLVALLLVLSPPCFATTYYVSNSGSNGNNGTSIGTPKQTIASVTSIANPGDIINIRAGTYNESLVISRPGSSGSHITLRGYLNERPLIQGTTSGPTIYFYTSNCETVGASLASGNTDCATMYWDVIGLEVRGSATGGGDGNAVKIDTPRVTLIGNKLCCAVADVVKVVRTANDATIVNNEIWQNSSLVTPSGNAQGVDIVGTDRPVVRGNYIHDVPDFGIYAKGNARNPLFENNRLVNIGNSSNGHALMCGQETDEELLLDGNYETYDCIIRNNVVVGSTWACVAVSSSSNALVAHNSCYNTGSSTHGSIFLSNESIVGQASNTVQIKNNIVVANPALPVIKINSDAFTSWSTLAITKNIYWTTTGAAPTFTHNGGAAVGFSAWQSNYTALTGNTDASTVANPLFRTTSGTGALALNSTSPAINAGVVISGITSDFNWYARGGQPDIGAVEFQDNSSFEFLAYGDSRAGAGCSENAVHIGLVSRMVAETNASMVFHTGDMVVGYNGQTNWVVNGECTTAGQIGSFKNIIAPLQNKTPRPGLSTFFYPVVGNHDDDWFSGWYPGPLSLNYGHGFCDVFSPSTIGMTNHTNKSYYLDPVNGLHFADDSAFFTSMCRKDVREAYSDLAYYKVRYKTTVFLILRVNTDYFNLMECGTCDVAYSNYDHYYNKHQRDWLQYELALAQSDATVDHIVILEHAPLVTVSDGHSVVTSAQYIIPDITAASKVKLVLQGHNHVYERSYPVKATVENPTGERSDADGIVFVTTGGGGSFRHGLNAFGTKIAVGYSEFHYVKLRVTAAGISGVAIKSDGTVMDRFNTVRR